MNHSQFASTKPSIFILFWLSALLLENYIYDIILWKFDKINILVSGGEALHTLLSAKKNK